MQLTFKDRKDVIKVITGMRRTGKSTLMNLFIERLRSDGVPEDRIFLMNFEMAEYQYIDDRIALNEWIMKNIPEKDSAACS